MKNINNNSNNINIKNNVTIHLRQQIIIILIELDCQIIVNLF